MRLGVLFAQTEDIQREVETQLWILRVYEFFGIVGIPPYLVLLMLLAAIVVVMAGVWLWVARRRRG